MQDRKDNCAICAPEPITAESILMSIIDWGPMPVREDLHELMCSFFLHHRKYRKEYVESIYFSYRLLFDALLQMEQYRKERGLLEMEEDAKEIKTDNKELSAEIQKLKEENHRLNKNNCKLLDDYIQLQQVLIDQVQPGWKSKECLTIEFRGAGN